MSSKTVSIEKLLRKSDEAAEKPPRSELSVERLAVDLLRHVIYVFRVKAELIPESSLPENDYPSSSFIKEVSRPVVFYSIALRDRLKNHFANFTALMDKKSDDKDPVKDEDKTECEEKSEDVKVSKDKTDDYEPSGDEAKAEDEDNEGVEIENNLIALYDELNASQRPDIYKQFIMSLVLTSELTQYLNFRDRVHLSKHMPRIWSKLFRTRISEEFKLAGDFDEYISYWAFMRNLESHILKFVKHCTPYTEEPSIKFKIHIGTLKDFKEPEVLKKILGFDAEKAVISLLSTDVVQTVKHLGFYPHERLADESEPSITETVKGSEKSKPGASGSTSTSASKTASKADSSATSSGKRAKKLRPKPGQTYSSFRAERRTELKEARQKEQELDRLAEGVERTGQFSESDEEEGS